MQKSVMILFLATSTATHVFAYTYTINNTTNSNATAIITYSRGLKRSVVDVPAGGSKSDSDPTMYATSISIKTNDGPLAGKETQYTPDTNVPRSQAVVIAKEGNDLKIKRS